MADHAAGPGHQRSVRHDKADVNRRQKCRRRPPSPISTGAYKTPAVLLRAPSPRAGAERRRPRARARGLWHGAPVRVLSARPLSRRAGIPDPSVEERTSSVAAGREDREVLAGERAIGTVSRSARSSAPATAACSQLSRLVERCWLHDEGFVHSSNIPGR